MSKISLLQVAGAVTGHEPIVLVQGGQTKQGSINALVAAALAAGYVGGFTPIDPSMRISYAYGSTDADGFTRRTAYRLETGGIHRFFGTVFLPSATVTFDNLAPSMQALVAQAVPVQSPYRWTIGATDADGFTRRLAVGLTKAGRLRGSIDAEVIESAPDAETANYLVRAVIGGDGRYQLRATHKATGTVKTITSAGNNCNPVARGNADIIFFTRTDLAAPLQAQRWMLASGGNNYAVQPGKRVRMVGHSQVAGYFLPTYVGQEMGPDWQVDTTATASQQTNHIAAAVGALATIITVAGNSVPAAGTVAVTNIDVAGAQADRSEPDNPFPAGRGPLARRVSSSCTFTWGGRQFILSTDAANNYSVAQVAGVAGVAAVAFPANTQVFVDQNGLDDETYVLWALRNSTNQPLQAMADLAAIFAAVRSYVKHIFVMGEPTKGDATEEAGTQLNANLAALNGQAAALADDRFIDLRKFLQGRAPYDGAGTELVLNADGSILQFPSVFALSGVAAIQADLDAIALDRTPSSLLRADKLHINDRASRAIGKLTALMLRWKGQN